MNETSVVNTEQTTGEVLLDSNDVTNNVVNCVLHSYTVGAQNKTSSAVGFSEMRFGPRDIDERESGLSLISVFIPDFPHKNTNANDE